MSREKSPIQYDRCDKLQAENHGDADGKAGVFAFVPDQVDAGQYSDASAQRSHSEEGALRDPPQISPGFVLVCNHKQKRNCID